MEKKKVLAYDRGVRYPVRTIDMVFLETQAKTGNWVGVDTKKIPLDLVNNPIYNGANLLHIAAQETKLHKFPRELITKEGLGCKSDLSDTVYHIAAGKSELKYIPKKFLTQEAMTTKNSEGNTPIHYAAMRAGLMDIPKALHTKRNFSITNNHNKTALDFAIFGLKGYGRHIDKQDIKFKEPSKNIRLILKKFSLKDLKYLYNRQRINFYDDFCREYLEKEILSRKLKCVGNSKTIEI